MNSDFKRIIDQLPILLKKLVKSQPKTRVSLGNLPPKGIYVFYERGNPIYVGRTNRMNDRIKEHGRQKAHHNTAPFAFNLARKDATEKGIDLNRTRDILERDPVFAELFFKAKKRVSQMEVRVIGIESPIDQTLFEVYASMDLKTEFNDFDTH